MTHYRPITLPEGTQITPPVAQPAPILQWVEIASIVIDDRYQRPITRGGWITIRKIATNFRWDSFTPVQLAPVEAGKFALIDGQHRTHAAAMCGITSVPGQIVPIASEDQARAFIQVNAARTGMSRFNLFKAAFTAGDPLALEASKAVADAGCRLMSFSPATKFRRPGDILSVGLILDTVRDGHALAVTTTLQAIRLIDNGGPSAMALYSDEVLRPLMSAVAQCPPISPEALADLLRKKRPFITIESAARLAKAENKPRAPITRQMFAAQIKQHLQSEGLA